MEDAADRLPKETPLAVVGTDTPQLSPKFLRKAFDALKDYAAVIGPNVNGGFYLLGFSSRPIPVSEVFSHSSSEETKELVRLLQRAHLSYVSLESKFDVDMPQDIIKLRMLIDRLEDSGGDWIPEKTRNVLLETGMLSLMTNTANIGA